MKTPTEEIQYLGQMLGCTEAGDTVRINSIIARLTEINMTEVLLKLEAARDAYKNMREFAEANGLDTVTRNQSPENV